MSKKAAMTEQEWLVCEDPAKMLKRGRFRSYRRKSRLFAVACCRCLWNCLVDERSKVAVQVAERYADNSATDEELRIASEAAHEAQRAMFFTVGKVGACIEWAAAYAADLCPFQAAARVSWMAATSRMLEIRQSRPNDFDEIHLLPCTVEKRTKTLPLLRGKWQVTRIAEPLPTGAEKSVQARLIRCIFGNPFHPTTFELSWITRTVKALAQGIYEDRNFTNLPILADALEEAGCTCEDILSHLRGPWPHTRGCWAVDLVLGKS